MRDRRADFGAGVEIVVVTFTDVSNLARYGEVNDVEFRLLVDPHRVAYQAYGLERASVARVWGLRAARRYFQIYRTRGLGELRRTTEDTLQLGGDFVIDPDGILRYGFWGAGPDDRPSVDHLVGAVRSS